MLKQVWRWVSLFPLLHPVWFNLLLLVLAWSIVGVAYQSNDDLVIASVLDGWGDPSYADAHVIFVNPLLTGLLLKAALPCAHPSGPCSWRLPRCPAERPFSRC